MARKKAKADPETITLAARLDVAAAEALHAELLEKRAAGDALSLDASEVSLIDTPAIQVLCAAASDQAGRGASFAVHAPSPAFTEAMTCVGLSNELQNWSGSNE